MKKLLIVVLSLYLSNAAQAQNSFWFTLSGNGWGVSANNYVYYPYALNYAPIVPFVPPQIITHPPYRTLTQVLVTVCGPYIYTRDHFGNLFMNRNCWTELRWQ